MPIEIKELHIRVAVNTSQTIRPPENRAATAGDSSTGPDDANDTMVAQCVEQVLQILENKTER
jgi:hypothetical protein